MILGYQIKDLKDIYKIYVHYNQKDPMDIFELVKDWEMRSPQNPEDCIKITAALAEKQEMDTGPIIAMAERFLVGLYRR